MGARLVAARPTRHFEVSDQIVVYIIRVETQRVQIVKSDTLRFRLNVVS